MKHFIFSSTAAVYGNPESVPVAGGRADHPDVALWLLEADDRNHPARHRRRAIRATSRSCAISMSRAPTRRCAPGNRPRCATHLIKVAVQTARRPAARRCRCSAPTIRRPTAPASATISMSAISSRAHSDALRYLREGGTSADPQLRLWPRLFGARGDRHGEARVRRRISGSSSRRAGPATRRRSCAGPGARAALALAAALRRSCHHRLPRARMGAKAARIARA